MPEHGGISEDESVDDGEKTESFLLKFTEPHSGQLTRPSHSDDRVRISESFEQSEQVNSYMGTPQ